MKKLLTVGIIAVLLASMFAGLVPSAVLGAEEDSPSITLIDSYGLDSDGVRVNTFNTTNLEEIEKMVLNFSIEVAVGGIEDWYFNFTANGTRGCSLGNKQSSNCYNFTNAAPYKWIQFINNTDTTTYDGTTGNQGDAIEVAQSGSGGLIYVNLTIDEHYNPNICKRYEGLLNFTDVKWQDGDDQQITKNNMIRIELDQTLVPIDADQYKLDFRVDHSATEPTEPLQAYACNDSYTTGDPSTSPNCMLVTQKLPTELQDDGTKFRGIFTKNLVDELVNLKYIVLKTDIRNPTRYYFIKTYNATAPAYTTHWNYSTDGGASWGNLGDGYETELNVNYFYDGANPTAFVYQMWANTIASAENTTTGNITWAINASQNYPPLVDIIAPLSDATILHIYTITFIAADPNDDELNVSLLLKQGGAVVETLITGMNQTNTSYAMSGVAVGDYQLVLRANETATMDLFSAEDTHNITLTEEICIPIINSWYNDKTEDNSTTIYINISEYVYFNTTANQTINTWSWFKDDIDLNNNFDNVTLTWITNGTKTLKVLGNNANGTTNIVTWTIRVGVVEEGYYLGLFLTIFGLAVCFFLYGAIDTGAWMYTNILSTFLGGTTFFIVGFMSFVGIHDSEGIHQYGEVGLLLVIFGVIAVLYGILQVIKVGMDEFGVGEKEEDRDEKYEYT